MTIEILQPSQLTEALQDQILELFKQLNSNIRQLRVAEVINPPNGTVIVICTLNKTLMAMASMAIYKVISGHKGIIEDVVVDKDHRGKGLGRKLMEKLLSEGKNRELTEILLFTGHHRTPAINLYKSMGFQLKESGLYTLKM